MNNINPQNSGKSNGGDWLTIFIAVAIPLLATMADPHVTLWVTFAAMVVLSIHQWRRGQFKGLIILPAIGAAVVVSASIVFWLKRRH